MLSLSLARAARRAGPRSAAALSTAHPPRTDFPQPFRVKARGIDVIHDPLLNKGTGFGFAERDNLGIRGLTPPRKLDLETQERKIMTILRNEEDMLRKNLFFSELQNRNETLYFRTLINNIEELAPVVYTPTIGQVCQRFGDQFRRPRGMYISRRDRGHIASMLQNWKASRVEIIVVTDGSRILGLGDLGVNGMGIPIGKLALYCAAGGISPHQVLPVMLDVGTNNPDLLEDPFYLGTQAPRLQGEEFVDMVDEFMFAVKKRWPGVMVQFEDFSSDNALMLLNRYRLHQLCFNDDIQGTGCTTLAGVLSALRLQDKPSSAIRDQKVICMGAGSAGLGVATTLMQGMVHEGLTPEEAQKNFYVFDRRGLLTTSRSSFREGQRFFARDDLPDGMSLLDAIKTVKPTLLLGLSSTPGIFNEEVVREMSKHCDRPMIFPLSNPTANAECTAAEAYEWSEGKAIFASGSPFEPVTNEFGSFYPSQCNNLFVFPGISGAVHCGAKRVSDRMFYEAAKAVAASVSEEEKAKGMVFPAIRNIRETSFNVAVAVFKEAIAERLDQPALYAKKCPPNPTDEQIHTYLRREMYTPRYVPLVPSEELPSHG